MQDIVSTLSDFASENMWPLVKEIGPLSIRKQIRSTVNLDY